MPNRGAGGVSYRYGFNGKETENDVKGIGNEQDYGMRIYDPRLGRFLSVDPLTKSYPWYTPYQFAGNKPIWAVDLDGLEEAKSTSAAVNAGVQQYVDEKREQAQSAGNLFTSWEPWKKLANYGKDWVRTVTGDREAIRRVNRKTTDALTGVSMSLAHTISDPLVFFSTMHTRSSYENVKGATYYSLVAFEMYVSWRITEVLDEPGPSVKSLENPNIRTETLVTVSKYLKQFGDRAENTVTLGRMREIVNGELKATETDINFAKHELREAEFMKAGMTYEEAHEAVLKEQNMYHKDYEKKLYTDEALKAGNAQMMKEATKANR